MESRGRQEKYLDLCTHRNFCVYLLYPLILYYSQFQLPVIPPHVFQALFFSSYLSGSTFTCVFMRRVPIYSPVYLYFSSPLQASPLLRQSSIFQIKWSWLKDSANVWFFKHACLSQDSRSNIRFALLFYVVWLWTFITSLLNELLIWAVIKAWLSYVCARVCIK